jgi:hypothetical protein
MRCSCSQFSRSCRSLAGEVHNVPEGLAVALVLVPRPLAAVSFSQYLVDSGIRQDDYWCFPRKICTVGQLLESTSIQRVALEYVACSLVPWIVMGLLLALGWLTDNIWQSRRRFGNLDCLHCDLDQRPTARTGAPCRTLETCFSKPTPKVFFFWGVFRMPKNFDLKENLQDARVLPVKWICNMVPSLKISRKLWISWPHGLKLLGTNFDLLWDPLEGPSRILVCGGWMQGKWLDGAHWFRLNMELLWESEGQSFVVSPSHKFHSKVQLPKNWVHD